MSIGEKAERPYRVEAPLALVALGVLLICACFAFAYAFYVPYPGLDYGIEWNVLRFDDGCERSPEWCEANQGTLDVGDRMLKVGDLTYDAFRGSATLIPFAGYDAGDKVPVTYVHENVVHEAYWQMLGPTPFARFVRLSGLLFVLPFWFAGSMVLLFLRPRDRRWLLLILFNYLTAVWLEVGFISTSRVAFSTPLLRLLALAMVPVYLHLHLLVPSPLKPSVVRYLLPALYGLAAILLFVEIIHPLPAYSFYLASMAAILGSLVLLIYRSFGKEPTSDRQATRLMLVGVTLGFGPGVLLWVVPTLAQASTPGSVLIGITTLTIPIQPLFYIYALYKRRLGDLEFRANRVLSLYSFILLFGTAFVTAFLSGGQWVGVTPQGVAFALFVSVAFLGLALTLQGPFQRFIDRLAYGTEHNPDTIVRTFANEIPRALRVESLVDLLTHEVSPALLIRQSALYSIAEGAATPVYSDGIPAYGEPDLYTQLQRLLSQSMRYLPAPDSGPAPHQPFGWARAAIPIEVAGSCNGVWLLGKRDPDDYYARPDIELLRTLGNQIGVALETARLFDNLQRRATELETAYRDLQRLDQLKDEFVQNISHELRTPLTFLRGYTDLLLEGILGPVTPQQQEALATMSDRTEGIIRLVNDIISLQNQRAEQTACEPVNLCALANSCIQAAQVAARQRGTGQATHVFEIECDDSVPPVLGDRRRLSQVIDNLLNNAVKFSPNGGTVRVTVAAGPYRFDDAYDDGASQPAVMLSIRDQGIGIPASELDRIWQRFYQVDGSSKRRFGGMGLGLAIVRSIVDAHNGRIWVDSELGRGSTFCVAFPVAPLEGQTVDNLVALC